MFPELEKYLRELAGKAKAKGKNKSEGAAIEAAGAVLVGATILFHTGNDDKDGDTRLEAFLNKAGNVEAAYSGFVYGHFEDGSFHPVQLRPKSNLMSKSEIPGSFIRVHIQPNGNDRWVFEQVPVELNFSDGTFYRKSFGFVTLTQDTNQMDFFL